jgi:hypothetical protein
MAGARGWWRGGGVTLLFLLCFLFCSFCCACFFPFLVLIDVEVLSDGEWW